MITIAKVVYLHVFVLHELTDTEYDVDCYIYKKPNHYVGVIQSYSSYGFVEADSLLSTNLKWGYFSQTKFHKEMVGLFSFKKSC